MTDLNDLIAQRDKLDREIRERQMQAVAARNSRWLDIDHALSQRGEYRWRKDDLIYTIGKVTVTLSSMTDPASARMYVGWNGNDYHIDFGEPVPAQALLALVDALNEDLDS